MARRTDGIMVGEVSVIQADMESVRERAIPRISQNGIVKSLAETAEASLRAHEDLPRGARDLEGVGSGPAPHNGAFWNYS